MGLTKLGGQIGEVVAEPIDAHIVVDQMIHPRPDLKIGRVSLAIACKIKFLSHEWSPRWVDRTRMRPRSGDYE